jgi:ABC-type proline/glycine betaine transport system permease subunit
VVVVHLLVIGLYGGWRLPHLAVALIIWAHIPAVIYGVFLN